MIFEGMATPVFSMIIISAGVVSILEQGQHFKQKLYSCRKGSEC
jgi:hypothetical protein